jgi:hypothetical protein
MDGGWVLQPSLQKIRTEVIDQGKRAIFIGGTCVDYFAQGVNDYLVKNDIYNYCWSISGSPQWTLVDSGHPLAEDLPDVYDFMNSYAGFYQLRTTDPDLEVVSVNGDGYNDFLYKGDNFPGDAGMAGQGDLIWFINSASEGYWFDQADFDVFKQIIANSLTYEPGGDLPWLHQVPVTGTVAGGDEFPVELVFDASVITQTGVYTGWLSMDSNDLGKPEINVPVTMTVVAPVTAMDIDAPVTQLIGEQSTIVTHVITVTNQSNHPDTYDLVLEGYWWATWAPATVEELWPGESATVEVRVAVPPTVLPGSSDTVVVNAVSQTNNAVFESVALTTTAAEHVATFTPDEMALMGMPGQMVTYTLMLENTGNIADTFVMTYTNNTWDVHMVGDTSMEMEPGESHAVIVQVMIPEDAADGDWDMVVIEVHGAPGQVAAAQLTTTAAFPKVYIPVIPQEFAP